MISTYSEKDPGETLTYAVDFTNVLVGAETLSATTSTVTDDTGADASPSAILSGSPFITGALACQVVTGGLDGSTYRLRFSVTTSTGRVLIGIGYIPVNTQ